MFLVEVLAVGFVLYWDCLTLEIRKNNDRALLHVANVLEVEVATFIRQEIHLIRLVYSTTIGLVVVKGMLSLVSPEAVPTDVVPVLRLRQV